MSFLLFWAVTTTYFVLLIVRPLWAIAIPLGWCMGLVIQEGARGNMDGVLFALRGGVMLSMLPLAVLCAHRDAAKLNG